jgi:hypothetical protein
MKQRTCRVLALVLVSGSLASSGAAAPPKLAERSQLDPRARIERARFAVVDTGRGALSSAALRAGSGTVLVATLEGEGEPLVTTLSGSGETVVSVQFGALGTVTYSIRPERETQIALVGTTVEDCAALRDLPLLAAVDEVLAPLRRGEPAELDGELVPLLAAASIAAEVLPECEGSGQPLIFDCARISPSQSACNGCCNDEIALLSLGLAALCPEMGIYGPVICGAIVHFQRRECNERCNEGYPSVPPSESERCGIRPDYGTCRYACPPGEHQSFDYPCLGPFLKCCVHDTRFP